MMKIHTL